MNFGERLRTLREAAGLSQVKLANRVGMASSYISDLERGTRKNPTGEKLAAIAQVLNVTVDELLQNGDSANNQPVSRYRQAILDAVANGGLPEGLTEEEMLQIEDALKLAEKVVYAQEKHRRK